jgi:hypothetical protein
MFGKQSALMSKGRWREKVPIFTCKRSDDGRPDAEPVITSILCRVLQVDDLTVQYDVGRIASVEESPPPVCERRNCRNMIPTAKSVEWR